eukprot:g1158.t1
MYTKVIIALFVLCATANGQIPANSQPVISGSTVGDFVLLGSLCFPPGADDQVKIITTTQNENGNQKILFFDDQTSSFDKINELSPTATCDLREDLARPICAGDEQCVTGYQVPKGTDSPYTIDISETFARRWYFVLSNCNNKVPAAVTMNSFRITSPAAISCSQLQQEDSTAGYIVAIVFLSLIIIVLTGVSYYMYKRGDVPVPLSNDKVGYNTL